MFALTHPQRETSAIRRPEGGRGGLVGRDWQMSVGTSPAPICLASKAENPSLPGYAIVASAKELDR
ncbi:MAG: hypothetical protein IPJ34_23780 [Myxococcales bacterium]|nr:hypothetical protein [Myxococcales bacterium]